MTATVDAATEAKIIRQVEYYFSDANLSKDKFMQEEIQKDAGWVSLETLTKFNRLKELSSDHGVIIECLKKSTANALEIDEVNKKVRRTKPLPENLSEFETSLKQNTVYAKGFPSTMLLDQLYAFFEQHGKVLQIFMRRFPTTKQFKGSVFVTFETNEQMKKFLELPEVKYEDTVLNRESQEAYFTRKGPELEKYKNAKKNKEQEKEEKQKQLIEAEEAYLKEQKIDGAILHMKGFNEQATREKLKELFDNFAKIRWVEYNKGDPEAHVRFLEANTAKDALEKALAAAGGKLSLAGADLEARVLEGEEEAQFWKDLVRKQAEARAGKKNNRSRGNKGKQRGGSGDYQKKRSNQPYDDNKNKRKAEDNGDSSIKKVKVETE